MRRLVIHAGFHKTGTTSIQQVLRQNRPVLKPHLRSILRAGLTEVVQAARGYSTWRDPITLAKFDRRFRRLLAGVAPMPRRVLCLSAEELSGHLPGRGKLADYSAAPILAARMARSASQLYPKADLVFFYTTRAPEPWLRSAYWEHVKASSMMLDFDTFRSRYGGAADLDAVVDAVARAVPRASVHRAALDEHRGAPARPLLDLCDVPAAVQAALPAAPPANSHMGEPVLAALLEANRRIADREARRAAKDEILRAARQAAGEEIP